MERINMETKFKACDKKTKNLFKDMLKIYYGLCPINTMCCKGNMLAYYKLYECMCKKMIDSYKYYCKAFAKYCGAKKHCCCKKKCCKNSPMPDEDDVCYLDTDFFPSDYLKEDSKILQGTKKKFLCADENETFSNNEEEFNIPEINETDFFDNEITESFCSDTEDELCISPDNEQDEYGIDNIGSSDISEAVNFNSLTASEFDICNYRFRNSTANSQIQAILKIDGRLDYNRLKRAVALSIDAVPVLGCRLVENGNINWERMSNIEETELCSSENAYDIESTMKNFLESTSKTDNDPVLKVKLIRSEQYDILGIKINNICCDGTGVKEYIQILSDIYSNIGQKDDSTVSVSELNIINDQYNLFTESNVLSPKLKSCRLSDTSGFMWDIPWAEKNGTSISFAINKLSSRSLERIYQYGNWKGATISDLLLTAFYRAMFKRFKPLHGSSMKISSFVDLRSYASETNIQPVRNYSAGFMTEISLSINEPFERTLLKVMHETKKLKEIFTDANFDGSEDINLNGNSDCLHNYFELVSRASDSIAQKAARNKNLCLPGLCNLGPISNSLIRFGENKVTDAFIFPPVMRVPGILLLTGSYNDVMTLSIGYCKDSINQRYIDGLLAEIKDEIMKGCYCQRWF